MSNPEMFPLIVAVAGTAPLTSKVAIQLRRRLIRRGFQVRVLRTPLERPAPDGDIILVPCQPQEVEKLAKQLEQEWTESWAAWYSHSKRPERK